MFASAQEPYAVLIDNGTALEFRYDNDKSAYSNAMSVGPFTEPIQRGWDLSTDNIRSIVFNQSFASCTSITSTAYWFAGMTNLETFIGLEYLNTSNVTAMNGMFWVCSALTSLDLSNFNTQSVSNMSNMFTRCSRLTTIIVGNGWSISNVSSSSEMFEECTSLVGGSGTTYDANYTDYTYAHIDGGSSNPGYLTGSSSTQDGPYWQELLSTLDYADELYGRARDNSNVEEWMLEELSMFINRGWDMYDEHTASEEEVRHLIEEINWICYEIEEAMNREPSSGDPEPYAVLSENNTVLTFYYDDQKEARSGMSVGPFNGNSYASWNELRRSITNVVFDVSFTDCTTLTSTAYWFLGCENLITITNFNNLKTGNVTDMTNMFSGCTSLTSLDLSTFDTSNVTNMNNMFNDCTHLTDLNLSGFKTDKVTNMGSMFCDCTRLPSLDVSGFNTGNVTTMDYMFIGCSHLTSLDLSNFDTSNVTNMSFMFHGCSSLTSLNLSGFKTDNVTNMASMFADCSSLTSLNVTGFNTSNVWNMQSMFEGCSGLTTLDVSNFDTSNVTGMYYLFQSCSSLTTLDLSNFDTSKVRYMSYMFNSCSSLTTIYVGEKWSTNSATTDGEGVSMFRNCNSIVGGRGTTYDANHTGISYAHIDGGSSNPGYFTDINGSGTSDLDQRRAELLNMIEQLMQQAEVCAYELNRKDPQRASNLWDNLADIEASIMDVKDRTERAESDAELDECEDRIRQIREGIEWLYVQIAEYAIGDASFDGLTARVSGSATLDDAFESVGGRAEAVKTIAAIIWNGDEALTADMLDGINNPNLLVYVTEASKAPAGVQNLIINGTAEEIILTDDSGNNNFYCPQSFTAQSISYTRSFSQTTEIEVCRGWETIALPFTVQSIRHQSHGALTPFGGGNNGYPFWLRQLSANGLTRATQIEANRPYLICMPNNRVYPSAYNQNGSVTFSSSNVTVPVTTAQTATGAGVTLRAAFQQVAQGSSVYTLNVGEARGEHPEGSVFEQDYREVRPFQAYTTHNAGTRYITLTSLGVGGDETTGVSELRNEELGDEPGEWYSLDGRRLEGKPTKKGVYVKDGHKYIIR